MAATQLDELSVKFTADVAGLRAGLEKIEIATLKMAATTEKATSKMSAGFATLGRFFTAGAVVAGIKTLASYSSQLDNLGESLVDMAGRANVSIESLQRLRFAADQNGGSADAMDTALVKLNKAMGEVIGGSEEMAKTFDALGLLELVKSGADTEKVLLGVADALKEIDRQFGPQLANAASLKIMGKNADELGVFMRSGADGVRGAEAAMSSAAIISDTLALKLAAMADKTATFNLKVIVLAASLEGVLIDALNNASKAADVLFFDISKMSAGIAATVHSLAPDLFDTMAQLRLPNASGASKPGVPKGAPPPIKPTPLGDVKNVFSGGGGGSSAADAAEKKIQHVTDALNLEIKAFEQSAVAQQIDEQLKRASVSANSDAGQMIAAYVDKLNDLTTGHQRSVEEQQASAAQYARVQEIIDANKTATERYADAVRELNDLHDSGKLPLAEWALSLKRVAETMDPITQAFDQMGERFADLTADAIVNGESLKEVFGQILQEIEKAIIKEMILKALGQSGGDGGVLDAIGSVLGSVVGLASGGGVSGGNPYLVGERGPELFIPNVGGDIVPNNRMGGGSMGFSYSPTIVSSGNNTAEIRQMLVAERSRIFGMMNKYIGEQSARGKLKLH